ncbi:bacteriohemerythrin [Hydrogenophaga sp. BPS33]|uniref:bacteriohemerythrin n=1 Tax=Hydrogenophaga sp. BPS33 TaxID=2651974 RepID=UPI00131FB593|nr:hemerythrin domain-containing protein [Hydrogenophaga sp. BPS33]QHE88376.1 hemerythrin [Hydrogenophaga sp. BPS33]
MDTATAEGLLATDAPLAWSDAFLLGYPPMDDKHREFVEVVAALINAPDAQVSDRLNAVEAHLRDHFTTEDRWMVETDFPPRDCHIDEHAAVLKSLGEVKERLEQHGDVETSRDFARELARWFPGHADYLDSALSHWMSKLRTGGKPVVLRRKLSFDETTVPETK